MWSAFEGKPNITRLFCKGELIEKDTPEFDAYYSHFNGIAKSSLRRLILFTIEKVESSCGMSVPKYTYVQESDALRSWVKNQANEGTLKNYIQEHEIPKDLGIS
jgi:hypothetical protein